MTVIIPVLIFGALVATLVDIIRREEWQVKHLPRVVWILLVVFIPLVGIGLWFALGREYGGSAERRPSSTPQPSRAQQQSPRQSPRHDPRGYAGAMHDPRSTEQQLADLEKEIEHYNRMRDRPVDG